MNLIVIPEDDLENIIRDVFYREIGVIITAAIVNGDIEEIIRRIKLIMADRNL